MSVDVLLQAKVSRPGEFIREGKYFVEIKDYEKAISSFLKARELGRSKEELSEIYLNLASAYCALKQSEKAGEYIRELLAVHPDTKIRADKYSPDFIRLFNEIKGKYPGIDAPSGTFRKEMKPVAMGRNAKEDQTGKKGKFPWLIVGGAVIVGGIAALLLLKKGKSSEESASPPGPQYGDISVTSEPKGAKVYLDGNDTGKTTDCTLTNVSVGTHSIKLEIANYGKWEGSVEVRANQTTNVTAVLSIYRYEFVAKWGSFGTGNGQFNQPMGIATRLWGPEDEIFVADTLNHRVQQFRPDGTFAYSFNRGFGSGSEEFRSPVAVAGGGSDLSLYVAEALDYRVQKFDLLFNFITKWGSKGTADGQFDFPSGIATDLTGNVYVTDYNNHRVQKFNSSGIFLSKWGSYGTGNGQFDRPGGIKVDSSGNVYVVEYFSNRIQKFTSNGEFITKWGSYGSANGQFDGPLDVAIDSSGYVFVTEDRNSRIQKFTSSGIFVGSWGSFGSGDGQFNYPDGIAIGSTGFIYVVDTSNNRVQKFRMTTQTRQETRISYTPLNNTRWGYGNLRKKSSPVENIRPLTNSADPGKTRIRKESKEIR
jgi:hypothetical protein